jgi:hypothetical protein
VSWRLAHEAKAIEVTWLAIDLLILLWAGGVIAREVKVTEGNTRSGHHLLEFLLFIALAIVVSLGVVILVGGGVELLPLRAVGDEVGGVAALETVPRRSSPLLAELVQGTKLSR